MRKRLIALLSVVGVLAGGTACAARNEDKLSLQKIVQESAHAEGVFRYSDRTPTTPFERGRLVQVRGLIEDDFRYKARLTVDGEDALDEVVNDDALAVRFVDPEYLPAFTSPEGGDANIRAALAARYWVVDPAGAPSIGDAAVADRTIGIDPIVDALSIVDYTLDAISAAKGVFKWNAERLDYRPLEDPFPRPARGSGVTRWDIEPADMPRADDLSGGAGNASLARAPVFRRMAIYVKGGKVVQIREQIAAKYDLLNRFRNYLIQMAEQQDDERAVEAVEGQIARVEDQPDQLEAFLHFGLNQILTQAGEEPVRFRTMVYEFSAADDVQADVPYGPDVKEGSLAFFGVNSKAQEDAATDVRNRIVDDPSSDASATAGGTTTTTSAP